MTDKFDLTIVNNMVFYISGPKPLFETTEISTQQESNYIYLYTTKFGTSIKNWLNLKFESTEFETMRVNCIVYRYTIRSNHIIYISVILELPLSVRGVGRRTQLISKLLNDLLITSVLDPTWLVQSALNPTCLYITSQWFFYSFVSGPL
jgi:hypothetical protein